MRLDGLIQWYKAKLVVKGFTQKFVLDYFDFYSPVINISTIRALFALASIHKLQVHQMDVKNAFLNGDLDEEIYMGTMGTLDWKLEFLGYPAVLEGYCDANWVSKNDEVSSTSRYVFTLGGAVISWKSSKQTCIARSTMESEFIALDLAGQEVEWLRSLLVDIPLWGRPTPPISLLCDSHAAICVAKNQAYNVSHDVSFCSSLFYQQVVGSHFTTKCWSELSFLKSHWDRVQPGAGKLGRQYPHVAGHFRGENLTELDIQENDIDDIGDSWLSCFPESFMSLEVLNFANLTSDINFYALEKLVGRCKSMRLLYW
ncbi:hypothetical protein F3Y22_tig00110410pilonHSYRG00135 [Hibiscus syriacus]|uniref:Reverse transcriptase Ty1/copia-type domain-containing protein n=1 Tax=Hibiscus syriacus TaxID=106335 RepID=A0A6A3AT00_HIBSY|nr:hypothetical protein F3Y22_tig00110410pilonHSYRG00135 [Hibiscus syriacus]